MIVVSLERAVLSASSRLYEAMMSMGYTGGRGHPVTLFGVLCQPYAWKQQQESSSSGSGVFVI